MKKKVAIQGIAGSYHDIAARNYHEGEEIEIIPCNTFRDVITTIKKDPAILGMMAIENTIAGSLLQNHELIRESGLSVTGEYKLRISHSLVALPGTSIHEVTEVNSHPIALMQCTDFLDTLPNAKVVEKEATSALDPNTTHSILTLIKDINRKLGITVVVITHQMSVVEEICDSVAILDGGVVVEQGSVQEIFANPKTAAAKRLVAPNGGSAARDLSCFAPDDHVVRVTFNGSSTAKPLVASLAAEKGILVSVLSADTRDLSGQCYGSMLLKLPAELAVAQQAVEYMRSQSGVTVEEVTGI